MSWGRVDDGLWEHQKFEALRESGEHAAGFLWFLAMSYTGRKGNPRITKHEAMLLLMCSEAEAVEACEVLRSRGLFDTNPASEQSRSWFVHDWSEYRSKDEAKAYAGRQGGIKSGETRRRKSEAKTKHASKQGASTTKQSRTPDPDPDPVTRSRYPLPDPDPPGASSGNGVGDITTGSGLTRAIASWGWTTIARSKDIARAKRLFPITQQEVDEHRPKTEQKANKKHRTAFFLGCVERGREEVAKEAAKPQAPPAASPQHPGSADFADGEDVSL